VMHSRDKNDERQAIILRQRETATRINDESKSEIHQQGTPESRRGSISYPENKGEWEMEQEITPQKRNNEKIQSGSEPTHTTNSGASVNAGKEAQEVSTRENERVSPQDVQNCLPQLPDFLPSWLPNSSVDALQAADIKWIAPQSLAGLSERLEWRVCRLYRDICFLFSLKDSRSKGYVFAEAKWFTEKYECNPATLRRWQAVLIQHGWLASIGKGPQRRLIPLLHPGKAVVFFARFARLFSGVLRGFWRRLPISPEKERNSNRDSDTKRVTTETKKTATIQTALTSQEQAVVAQLRTKGIGTDSQAISLVREYGINRCLEQMDALSFRRAINPGAILAASIRENYPAPPGLIAQRESENRREEERLKAQELMRRRALEKQRRAEEASQRARQQAENRATEQEQRRKEAPSELLPLWDQALEFLKQTITGPSFATHIASLAPVSRAGDCLYLETSSAFVRDWVRRRHMDALTAAISRASGIPMAVEIIDSSRRNE